MNSASGGSIVNGISFSSIPETSDICDEEQAASGSLVTFSEICPKQMSGNRIETRKTGAVLLPELNIIIG